MMAEKIKVSSRASPERASRCVARSEPGSTSLRKRRLSLASFRQIFTRIKNSFLLNASSASIQLADVLCVGDRLWQTSEKAANRFGKQECSILQVSRFCAIFHGFFSRLGFGQLLGIWDLGFGACRALRGLHHLLRGIGQIAGGDHGQAGFRDQLLAGIDVRPFQSHD